MGKGPGGIVIGERRAVLAFLADKPLSRGPVEVEMRESPATSDPRSGRPLAVPPVAVMWIAERPMAVKLRGVVALSSFPPDPRLATLLEGECLAAGFGIERMPESGLWRLFSHPPRPRLAR
jgi:hypothetical protein